ncbi:MAG: hypothetical protein HXK18_08175 [Alloprevotella tannerae]|nr:hypothetical protein [Alloprevotella tannerae]
MSRLRAYFVRHSAPRFALSSLFYFVWWQQTIVWSEHTIVWRQQTIVWREQTKRDLSHRAVQGLFRQGVFKFCSRLMRRTVSAANFSRRSARLAARKVRRQTLYI